jgi:hypothetical protein
VIFIQEFDTDYCRAYTVYYVVKGIDMYHKAILSRVTQDGLGYLVDKDSHKVFAFTFDKISNYKGQTTTELGISAGSPVTYDIDGLGHVVKVEIAAPQPKKRAFAW